MLRALHTLVAEDIFPLLPENRCGEADRTYMEEVLTAHFPEDIEHTFWCYPVLLDQDKLGVEWRTFRQKFIECGGDGLYGCYTPVHLEPVFKNLSFYGDKRRSPLHDPRYQGNVKSYREGDCPNLESFRKRLCLFKTGMQTLDKVYSQVEALQKVIRYFHGT
jgi:hypothetical protein